MVGREISRREDRRGLRSLFREDGVGLLVHGNGLGFLSHGDRFRFGFDLDRFRLLGLGWLNDDESGLARGGGFRDGRCGRSCGLDLRIHEHALRRVGVAAETVVSIVLGDVRQDAGAHRTPFRAAIPEPFRRISTARVAVVTAVLLQKGELATAVWTWKTGHAIPWRLGGSNKAFSMIPKNEILLREFGRGPRKTLLPQRPIGSPRHHSSVGRAAAL